MDNNPEFIDGRWHFDPNKPVFPASEVNVFDQERMESDDECTIPLCPCREESDG